MFKHIHNDALLSNNIFELLMLLIGFFIFAGGYSLLKEKKYYVGSFLTLFSLLLFTPMLIERPVELVAISAFIFSGVLVYKANRELSGIYRNQVVSKYLKFALGSYSIISGLIFALSADYPIYLMHKTNMIFNHNMLFTVNCIISTISIVSSLGAIYWNKKLIKEYSNFDKETSLPIDGSIPSNSVHLLSALDPGPFAFLDSGLMEIEGEIGLILIAIILLPFVAFFASFIFLGLLGPYTFFFTKPKSSAE